MAVSGGIHKAVSGGVHMTVKPMSRPANHRMTMMSMVMLTDVVEMTVHVTTAGTVLVMIA